MARVCQITGKATMSGHKVSHSNRKTKRKFLPNLFVKKFFVPEFQEYVYLKVSAAGIRAIDKNGIYASIQQAIEKGHISK